jgi:hypothetical protein
VSKLVPSGALLGGALAGDPNLLGLLVAVVVVVVVLTIYRLAAKRGIATRLRWGKFELDLTRMPEKKRKKR